MRVPAIPRRYSVTEIAVVALLALLHPIAAPIKWLWNRTWCRYSLRMKELDDAFWKEVYRVRMARQVLRAGDRYLFLGVRNVRVVGEYIKEVRDGSYATHSPGEAINRETLAEVCAVDSGGNVIFHSYVTNPYLKYDAVKVTTDAEERGLDEEALRKAPYSFDREEPGRQKILDPAKRVFYNRLDSHELVAFFCGYFEEERRNRNKFVLATHELNTMALSLWKNDLPKSASAQEHAMAILARVRAIAGEAEPRPSLRRRLQQRPHIPPEDSAETS